MLVCNLVKSNITRKNELNELKTLADIPITYNC